jgi:hypothetical protein
MIHGGDAVYYQEMNAIIEVLNHILMEGVSVKYKFAEIGRYEVLAGKARLQTQRNGIGIPADI